MKESYFAGVWCKRHFHDDNVTFNRIVSQDRLQSGLKQKRLDLRPKCNFGTKITVIVGIEAGDPSLPPGVDGSVENP